jgi:hypothetical protein
MRPAVHTGVLRLQNNCKGTSVYHNITNNVITQNNLFVVDETVL